MILGTWMYALQLRIERWRTHRTDAQFSKACMPLGMLLVTPTSTSGLEGVFMVDGKMPVVTGVAVIILVGLAIWWVRALNTLNSMKETTSEETPTA